jgi:hypothetical protein
LAKHLDVHKRSACRKQRLVARLRRLPEMFTQ